ncbi:DNA/RNA helicase [Chengkuizengella axinellae]|uniref:DNA/RNA helicase n=1 Tax=Chengkuizengella axinellae TaxID=3064388 RepID=A0ABT9J216_9BACL|nr:DNA/RNA helicase [Chengkuizengella sp. 2205SS18-9]MDP5275055.1 DNA/RNA helicase [Chengkuizengella sp. 2205SS18-9]
MDKKPIIFEFEDKRSAFLALDTLEELGYEVFYHDEFSKPTLHIHIEKNDLTSALEIIQAHGGTMVEEAAADESRYVNAAYGIEKDQISIPAHTVVEDLTEEYLSNNKDELKEQTTDFEETNYLSADDVHI